MGVEEQIKEGISNESLDAVRKARESRERRKSVLERTFYLQAILASIGKKGLSVHTVSEIDCLVSDMKSRDPGVFED